QAGLYDILRHELVWGQIHDSFLGVGVIALLIWRPRLIEEIGRKQWTVWFLTGIVLLLLVIIVILDTATSTTALQVGNIPIQVTELLKVTMLLFLAWVIDREGSSIQQPQHVVMGIVIPPLSLLLPSGVFAFISATLLFAIGDLGSILILMPLFGLLLYIGFDDHSFFTLTFGTTIVIIVVTYLLFHLGVSLPTHVVNRWLAFLDPWSLELVEGIPIVDGIGQQLQHGIYAITAGSMLGSGIGFGYPHIIPAVWSDFVWAAIVEENGYLITVALLAIYCIIFWRIVRVALLLQDEMRFERMLIAGVAIHLVLQLFFMTAGTTKLFVMTGVTVPFLSHGGVALIVNLAEIGLVLALSQRLEGAH
ncbi:MAG: FtsW/RodA/SpoVE family cell cycle protein, partial [Candidatus Promineifilaceae bacterium]